MTTELVMALLGVTAACFYTAGRLTESKKRIADKDALIDQMSAASKAYQNSFVTRNGAAPIFNEAGDPVIQQPLDDSPVQILKPPFAAAEDRWDEEDEAKRPMTLQDVVHVPGLTEDQKEALRNRYKH